MAETRASVTPDTQPRVHSAGLGSRFLARLLDALIVGTSISIGLALFGLPAPTIGLGGTEAWGRSAVTALIWFTYYVISESATGTTVGKRLAKLRVLGKDSDKPSPLAAAIRNSWIFFGLVPWLGAIALPAVVVVIAVTISRRGSNRGVHDLAAGTTVVT